MFFDQALVKLIEAGGEGAFEVQKKYSRKGKVNLKKKIHAPQLTLKNIYAKA